MGRRDLPSAESDEEEEELERESERRRNLYAPRASSPASAVVHRSGREGSRHEQSPYTPSSHTSSPYTSSSYTSGPYTSGPYAPSPYAPSPLRGSSSTTVSEPYVEAPVIPPVIPSPVFSPVIPPVIPSPVISPVIPAVIPPMSMEDYVANTVRSPQVDRSPSISSSSSYQGREPIIPKSISRRREQAYAASPLRNGSMSGAASHQAESAAPRGQQYMHDQRYGENSYGVVPPPPQLKDHVRRPHNALDTPVQSMYARHPDTSLSVSPSSSSHRDRQRHGDANELSGLMDNLSLSRSGYSSSSSRMTTPDTYHVRSPSTNAPRRRESANMSTPRASQQDQARYQSRSSSKAPPHEHERW